MVYVRARSRLIVVRVESECKQQCSLQSSMRVSDRVRLFSSTIMVILGMIIIVRALLAEAPIIILLGVLFVALGAYRLYQFRRFRRGGVS
jgi:uncharacterized membrane protein HdeD (DUF308 family)